MKEYKEVALNGAEAAAEAMRQIDPDVVPLYPITPATIIAHTFSRFYANGQVTGETLLVESEHSAMSACIAASAMGVRTMTATGSQGLAYMWEMLGIASSYRLPIVMLIGNRAISGPGNIHCDHSDSMGARDLSWIQIYCENAQEAYENTLLAVRLAEKVLMPVMVCQDGFFTTGSVVKVRIYEDKIVKKFIGEYNAKQSLLNFKDPITYGWRLMDSYFETKVEQEKALEEAKKVYLDVGRELSKITESEYGYFEEYKLGDAEHVIVVMSSTAGLVKDVVDRLREKDKKVGLLKIKLFRPFVYEQVKEALKNAKNIAVLDRAESYGAYPPLFTEIVSSLYGEKIKIQSYIFGIGGRYIYGKDIEKVFDDLINNRISNKKKYIGVKDGY